MAEAQIEKSQADWIQREQELLKTIEVLEADKAELSASNGASSQKLAEDLSVNILIYSINRHENIYLLLLRSRKAKRKSMT